MMTDFSKLPVEGLLRPEGFDCDACGQHHDTTLRHLKIGSGILDGTLVPLLRECGGKRPFIVADRNTDKAAGRRVTKLLDDAGVSYTKYLLTADETEPDEHAVGQVAMAYDSSCDFIIAVGSGVIGDICKILSMVSGHAFLVVATAPSMDGYASNSSSMVVGGIKSTIYTACPVAVIADTDILCQAPMIMLYSGLGDMLAKYISVCEWRISHEVTGEYYCEHIAQLMRNAVVKCREGAQNLKQRDPKAVASITEGLVLSGIAMSFAKVSRPASGLEHYFSHIWDMSTLERGTPGSRHGIQVGIGTVLALRVYDRLKKEAPDREKALASVAAFDEGAWQDQMRRMFPKTADNIIALEAKVQKHDKQKHARRLEVVLQKWDRLAQIMNEELPDSQPIYDLLREIGEPALPIDIGIGKADTKDAMLATKEIRDKYIASSLLWDLGLLEEYADWLTKDLAE